jgi:hypothetical protein
MNILLTLCGLILMAALSVSETIKTSQVSSFDGFSDYQARVNAIRNNQ